MLCYANLDLFYYTVSVSYRACIDRSTTWAKMIVFAISDGKTCYTVVTLHTKRVGIHLFNTTTFKIYTELSKCGIRLAIVRHNHNQNQNQNTIIFCALFMLGFGPPCTRRRQWTMR